jgi:hypothetical protein
VGTNSPEIVFNTGQVIRGLLRTYQETKREEFLAAAIRAGKWITSCQNDDGSWSINNYKGVKRVYDSYVAAPLASLGVAASITEFVAAAEKNCMFVLAHQRENGTFELFDNDSFDNRGPITHTLMYAVDGLLETGQILGKPEFIGAARKTTQELAGVVERLPRFYGRFDEHWNPTVSHVCLTGCAQFGVVLLKLYRLEGEPRYKKVAEQLIDFLAYTQALNGIGKNRVGGVAGAYPIWGKYGRFTYPSWAAKYFVDLLLLADESQSG